MTVAPRMRMDLLLTALEEGPDSGQLLEILHDLRGIFGVDHIVFQRIRPVDHQGLTFSTYSHDWQKRYVDQGYLRINPVIRNARQHAHPMNWKDMDWSDKPARAFLQDAIAHGVGRQGFSVPVYGPRGQLSVFSINHHTDDESWDRVVTRHRRNVILLAHMLYNAFLALDTEDASTLSKALSPREHDTLSLLAQGFTRAQVADKLQISQHTLRVYIESARNKLGATNALHTVARGLSLGIVDI